MHRVSRLVTKPNKEKDVIRKLITNTFRIIHDNKHELDE